MKGGEGKERDHFNNCKVNATDRPTYIKLLISFSTSLHIFANAFDL